MSILLVVLLALIAPLASPATAHPLSTDRYVPYNSMQVFGEAGNYCTTEVQHGNYNGAYINKMFISLGQCIEIDAIVTGCQGLNCPDGPIVSTTTGWTWISSQLPGYNIIYSHCGSFADAGLFYFSNNHNYF